MEEKRIPSPQKVDLTELEAILDKENELLLKGRGVKDSTDETAFSSKRFFSEVGRSSGLFKAQQVVDPADKEKLIQQLADKQNLIRHVADRLEKIIPEMLTSLDYRGDDILVAELYTSWIQFLSTHGLENARLIETVTEYGGIQIQDTLQKFQFGPAFSMFQFSMEKIHNRHIPEDNKEAVAYFVKESGVKALSSYASSEENSISRNIDYERVAENKVYEFTSYAEPAVKTYGQMLHLMAKVSSPEQLLSYTVNAHQVFYEKIQNAKKGTFKKVGDSFPEILEPDYSSMVTCVKISMDKIQVALKEDPDNDTLVDFIIDNVPSLMNDLIKDEEGTLALDLYKRTVELNDPESRAGFTRAFGGRYAANLRDSHPVEMAHMLLDIREALRISKNDILILTDPESPQEAPVPMAILSHAHSAFGNQERDMVMFREVAYDTLVRDSNVKNDKFQWLDFKSDFISRSLVEAIRDVHHTDYFSPLTHPDIKHHGKHVHSCTFLTLRLQQDF